MFLSKTFAIFKMDTKISRVIDQLDAITSYLKPFLPLVNCHMVEFITENHWETYLPKSLRDYLDSCDLDVAVQQFWNVYSNPKSVTETTELIKWVNKARSHCLSANNDYCLTVPQLEDRITSIGGVLKPEIKVSQFMTSKKSYEVQVMSRLVAGLSSAAGCSHCVEVGGGRAPLPAALALGYNQPVLTVDCNEATINTAKGRIKVIQKQWHAIAKRIGNDTQDSPKTIDNNLNSFVSAFVTQDTDLLGLVRQNFPESREDTKLLLTGLHTCGNLGPDSLRLFTAHPYIGAIFNTPCCYHLLSEDTDVGCFDVFQKAYGSHRKDHGFPMSEHMRGYNLGRNARMLAAQSIDRVVDHRELPCRSLLYRAMLQMVIKEKPSQKNITEGKLKGLGGKCQDFREYFKMADALLKLDVFDSLPDSYFAQIQQTESCQWKKIVLFYLMRLCLAQVVESVILLDRLLYLHENGFNNVYLVKLFDPVMSPRCHSIVAIR
ncbi:methyltransferase-like protein 25 isoform X2 [Aricia agestis]|uniref:methyltransferase-like protein 25 isoform X2 n=1 Tax=Aricia agestis TaxID=91739 RepID=UPI001C2036E0|nr:methyltransferase-like protein 25 isoform X2 [Aricia agestis]